MPARRTAAAALLFVFSLTSMVPAVWAEDHLRVKAAPESPATLTGLEEALRTAPIPELSQPQIREEIARSLARQLVEPESLAGLWPAWDQKLSAEQRLMLFYADPDGLKRYLRTLPEFSEARMPKGKRGGENREFSAAAERIRNLIPGWVQGEFLPEAEFRATLQEKIAYELKQLHRVSESADRVANDLLNSVEEPKLDPLKRHQARLFADEWALRRLLAAEIPQVVDLPDSEYTALLKVVRTAVRDVLLKPKAPEDVQQKLTQRFLEPLSRMDFAAPVLEPAPAPAQAAVFGSARDSRGWWDKVGKAVRSAAAAAALTALLPGSPIEKAESADPAASPISVTAENFPSGPMNLRSAPTVNRYLAGLVPDVSGPAIVTPDAWARVGGVIDSKDSEGRMVQGAYMKLIPTEQPMVVEVGNVRYLVTPAAEMKFHMNRKTRTTEVYPNEGVEKLSAGMADASELAGILRRFGGDGRIVGIRKLESLGKLAVGGVRDDGTIRLVVVPLEASLTLTETDGTVRKISASRPFRVEMENGQARVARDQKYNMTFRRSSPAPSNLPAATLSLDQVPTYDVPAAPLVRLAPSRSEPLFEVASPQRQTPEIAGSAPLAVRDPPARTSRAEVAVPTEVVSIPDRTQPLILPRPGDLPLQVPGAPPAQGPRRLAPAVLEDSAVAEEFLSAAFPLRLAPDPDWTSPEGYHPAVPVDVLNKWLRDLIQGLKRTAPQVLSDGKFATGGKVRRDPKGKIRSVTLEILPEREVVVGANLGDPQEDRFVLLPGQKAELAVAADQTAMFDGPKLDTLQGPGVVPLEKGGTGRIDQLLEAAGNRDGRLEDGTEVRLLPDGATDDAGRFYVGRRTLVSGEVELFVVPNREVEIVTAHGVPHRLSRGRVLHITVNRKNGESRISAGQVVDSVTPALRAAPPVAGAGMVAVNLWLTQLSASVGEPALELVGDGAVEVEAVTLLDSNGNRQEVRVRLNNVSGKELLAKGSENYWMLRPGARVQVVFRSAAAIQASHSSAAPALDLSGARSVLFQRHLGIDGLELALRTPGMGDLDGKPDDGSSLRFSGKWFYAGVVERQEGSPEKTVAVIGDGPISVDYAGRTVEIPAGQPVLLRVNEAADGAGSRRSGLDPNWLAAHFPAQAPVFPRREAPPPAAQPPEGFMQAGSVASLNDWFRQVTAGLRQEWGSLVLPQMEGQGSFAVKARYRSSLPGRPSEVEFQVVPQQEVVLRHQDKVWVIQPGAQARFVLGWRELKGRNGIHNGMVRVFEMNGDALAMQPVPQGIAGLGPVDQATLDSPSRQVFSATRQNPDGSTRQWVVANGRIRFTHQGTRYELDPLQPFHLTRSSGITVVDAGQPAAVLALAPGAPVPVLPVAQAIPLVPVSTPAGAAPPRPDASAMNRTGAPAVVTAQEVADLREIERRMHRNTSEEYHADEPVRDNRHRRTQEVVKKGAEPPSALLSTGQEAARKNVEASREGVAEIAEQFLLQSDPNQPALFQQYLLELDLQFDAERLWLSENVAAHGERIRMSREANRRVGNAIPEEVVQIQDAAQELDRLTLELFHEYQQIYREMAALGAEPPAPQGTLSELLVQFSQVMSAPVPNPDRVLPEDEELRQVKLQQRQDALQRVREHMIRVLELNIRKMKIERSLRNWQLSHAQKAQSSAKPFTESAMDWLRYQQDQNQLAAAQQRQLEGQQALYDALNGKLREGSAALGRLAVEQGYAQTVGEGRNFHSSIILSGLTGNPDLPRILVGTALDELAEAILAEHDAGIDLNQKLVGLLIRERERAKNPNATEDERALIRLDLERARSELRHREISRDRFLTQQALGLPLVPPAGGTPDTGSHLLPLELARQAIFESEPTTEERLTAAKQEAAKGATRLKTEIEMEKLNRQWHERFYALGLSQESPTKGANRPGNFSEPAVDAARMLPHIQRGLDAPLTSAQIRDHARDLVAQDQARIQETIRFLGEQIRFVESHARRMEAVWFGAPQAITLPEYQDQVLDQRRFIRVVEARIEQLKAELQLLDEEKLKESSRAWAVAELAEGLGFPKEAVFADPEGWEITVRSILQDDPAVDRAMDAEFERQRRGWQNQRDQWVMRETHRRQIQVGLRLREIAGREKAAQSIRKDLTESELEALAAEREKLTTLVSVLADQEKWYDWHDKRNFPLVNLDHFPGGQDNEGDRLEALVRDLGNPSKPIRGKIRNMATGEVVELNGGERRDELLISPRHLSGDRYGFRKMVPLGPGEIFEGNYVPEEWLMEGFADRAQQEGPQNPRSLRPIFYTTQSVRPLDAESQHVTVIEPGLAVRPQRYRLGHLLRDPTQEPDKLVVYYEEGTNRQPAYGLIGYVVVEIRKVGDKFEDREVGWLVQRVSRKVHDETPLGDPIPLLVDANGVIGDFYPAVAQQGQGLLLPEVREREPGTGQARDVVKESLLMRLGPSGNTRVSADLQNLQKKEQEERQQWKDQEVIEIWVPKDQLNPPRASTPVPSDNRSSRPPGAGLEEMRVVVVSAEAAGREPALSSRIGQTVEWGSSRVIFASPEMAGLEEQLLPMLAQTGPVGVHLVGDEPWQERFEFTVRPWADSLPVVSRQEATPGVLNALKALLAGLEEGEVSPEQEQEFWGTLNLRGSA